jgi:hypothetical protein
MKPISSHFGAVLEPTELTWEFQAWCQSNRMPEKGDAQELLDSARLTKEQRAWLVSFLARWEAAQ